MITFINIVVVVILVISIFVITVLRDVLLCYEDHELRSSERTIKLLIYNYKNILYYIISYYIKLIIYRK